MTKDERAEKKLLGDIRNLLILQLIKEGTTYEEVASVLGVSHMTVRRLMAEVKKPRKED